MVLVSVNGVEGGGVKVSLGTVFIGVSVGIVVGRVLIHGSSDGNGKVVSDILLIPQKARTNTSTNNIISQIVKKIYLYNSLFSDSTSAGVVGGTHCGTAGATTCTTGCWGFHWVWVGSIGVTIIFSAIVS